jgi:flagellar P-ring protein precursor FlgI
LIKFFRLPAALCCCLLLAGLPAGAVPQVRVKDIATIQGIRTNQLSGIGLVTGLAGKGDGAGSELLKRTLSNFIQHFGIEIAPADIKSRNCAVVMVSAEVPGFIRPGERLDVQVASIGDARSLDGGMLLQTNLQAANEQVYAVAQGKIAVPLGGNGRTSGAAGSAALTLATIPQGAIVEREIVSRFVTDNRVSLILKYPDFVTANTLATVVRTAFAQARVVTRDASSVEIELPEDRRADPVAFISELESLSITPDSSNKVVIDARSGIIIMGEQVRIGKVAVSYKDISVSVGAARWGDDSAPTYFTLGETTNVDDFVKALQTIGLAPQAIIEILKAIDKAGALYGVLVIL